jgi:hypothetical protein
MYKSVCTVQLSVVAATSCGENGMCDFDHEIARGVARTNAGSLHSACHSLWEGQVPVEMAISAEPATSGVPSGTGLDRRLTRH